MASTAGEGWVVDESIRTGLLERGSVQAPIAGLRVRVDLWRARARAVGRDLGRPVRTFLAADYVLAVLSDWPRDDREKALHERHLRAVVENISLP